jgi:streptomycin 6-kinase
LEQPVLNIPDKVRRSAEAQGEKGRAWMAALPAQIAAIERRWNIRIGTTTRNATEAYVAFAEGAQGEAVVKIVIPGFDATRQEMRILAAAAGRGYARLLRADETENVLLLERLGPQLFALGLSNDAQIAHICATLAEAWQVRPEGVFVTGAERADELAAMIRDDWPGLGEPCAMATYDAALAAAARRRQAFDPAHAAFAHGDAHAWNTLQATESPTGFKFVDPDGAFAERAFDLAIPMREWGQEIFTADRLALGRQRCELLARLTGVGTAPIWDWSLLQCVSNSVSLQKLGLTASARVGFAMADAWVAGGVFD